MAGDQPQQPRRTLGDYAMQQGPKYFSSIAKPITIKVGDEPCTPQSG